MVSSSQEAAGRDRPARVGGSGGNANATATTGTGFRSGILASHEPAGAPLREAQRITAVAPMTSNRRMSRCPIFEVFPSFCLPPWRRWRTGLENTAVGGRRGLPQAAAVCQFDL